MASTYSPNLALTLIGTGDQAGAWGNTTNVNLGTLLEQAISGYVTQTIADVGDTTITIPNGATGVARNMAIECTGALTAARNLLVPNNKKLYVIYNNTTGGYAVTVKVAGQTGVSVPNGKKMLLVCNGTDIVNAINYLSGTATNVTGTVAVANGGTGLTTTPSNGQLLIGNGTGFSLANIQAGANVTVTNSAGGITISASGGGGGGGGGTVTSVDVSGGTTGLTTSGGPVTGAGTITLAGTLGVPNGGTGATTLTGYVKGNGASAMTASSTIPGSDISGNITGNAASLTSTLPATLGGTGQTSYTSGQVLVGNSSGGLTKTLITGSGGITVTSGSGTIDISGSGSGAGVSSFSAGTTGLTPSTATTGAVTLGGTLAVANGGTGSTTTSGARTALDVPSTTGSGASGTWSISINGNAATVTNGVVTSGSYANPSWITSLASSKLTGAVAVGTGGTGLTTTPTNGQLLIGNGSGYTLANLTAGSNITITNSAGGISIAATGGSGTVTGVTASSPLASSGGTAPNISLSGAVAIGNGGTGQTTQQAAINALAGSVTGGYYLRGNGSNITMAPIQSGDVPTAFLRYSSSGSAVVTASTSSPTGGSDGDIWLKY